MITMSTFFAEVYAIVQDFCKDHPAIVQAQLHRPGPWPKLDLPAVMSLSICAQWARFRSERDFYRYAQQALADCCAEYHIQLPDRSQYNRQARRYHAQLAELTIWVAEQLQARHIELQVIDTTPIVVRDNRRRGCGWLTGDSDVGHCTRLGWFQGFRLLVAVGAYGAITGYCIAPASTNERRMAEMLLMLRQYRSTRTPSVGLPAIGNYVADKGFAGRRWIPRWRDQYQARVICQGQQERWPRQLRRWLAHYRQIIETIFGQLNLVYGLDHERPHSLSGLQMRLAAKIAAHNIVIVLNHARHRPALATADLIDWT